MQLHSKGRVWQWQRPLIMAVVNATPDSFYDGGVCRHVDAAVERAQAMAADGADIIDIGGESTRPGAQPVTPAEEVDRVLPVIEALTGQTAAMLSVDTSKPAVMTAACAAGADMINDINALRAQGALQAAAAAGAAVCLMHMQGTPRTMQQAPHYDAVVVEVRDFLTRRLHDCNDAGICAERIVVDPGFGFGKTLDHNLELLRQLESLTALGRPLLVGLSRKSMFAKLMGDLPAAERLPASVAAAAVAVLHGASIVRTHDVAATRQAVMLAHALRRDAGA